MKRLCILMPKKVHVVREKVRMGLIEVRFVPTKDNLAETFTKAVNGRKTGKLCAKPGLK